MPIQAISHCPHRWTLTLLGCAASAILCPGAQAGEVYAGLGFPGLTVGYAHPLNSTITVRADYASWLGSRSKDRTEEGIRYHADLKLNRLGAFADWFSEGNSFRLTGGLTSNQYKIDLNGGGLGSSLQIGGTTYNLQPGDRFDVHIKFPSVTPYLGIGWGHQGLSTKGWGFHADIGAAFGKAKVSTSLSGTLAQNVSQADVDAETAQIRDGVGKIRAVPQFTLGVSYRF